MRRMLAVVSLTILASASLSGCAQADSTASTGCPTTNSSITWSDGGNSDSYVHVGLKRLDYRTRSGEPVVHFYPEAAKVGWRSTQLSALAPGAAAYRDWKRALLSSVKGTSLVPSSYGQSIAGGARAHAATLTQPHARFRVYLISVQTQDYEEKFSIRCGANRATGTFFAPPSDAFSSFNYECGTRAPINFTKAELAHCDG